MASTARAYEACPNHPDVVSGLVACARCGVAYCGDCVVQLDGHPYDGACKEEQVRDLRSGTAAPAIATAGRRFGAMFVDGLVFTPVWLALILVYPQDKPFDHPLQRILVPAALWMVYETWMLAKFAGQTVGKKAAGIRVIRRDGGAVTAGQALWRALSRNLMSYTYLPGLIDALMVYSRDRRTLHDRACGTVVVNARP
jgi:uncharacterized RDD family membrane protein YckC